MRLGYLCIFGFVAACGITPASQKPEVLSARIAAETTTGLCAAYKIPTTTARGKLMIEAELAVRGVKQCSGVNYGQASSAAFGSKLYGRTAATPRSRASSSDLRNCSDFKNGAAAQKFFLALGGPVNDPNNLDADGDGLACEWGTQIRRISSYRAPVAKPRRTVRRSTSSYCYTGPRGGRYTISASGTKNYGGC